MLKSTQCDHHSLQSKVAAGMVIYRCRKCHAVHAKSLKSNPKSAPELEYMARVGLDRNILYLTGAMN